MRYLLNMKELTISELLSIAIVFTAPFLIIYNIVT